MSREHTLFPSLLGRVLGPDWDAMNRTLQAYIGLTCVIGAYALLAALRTPTLAFTHELAILLIVSALLGPRSISLGYSPNTKIELLVSHPLVFTAVIVLGPAEAVLVSEVGLLAGLLTTQRHMRLYRALFNSASFAYTTWAAGWTYYALGGNRSDIASSTGIVALLAALLVYYALNTFSVAVAVSLFNHAPLLHVWRENFLWSAPSHFAGGSIALAVAYFIRSLGIVSLVLALPFCVLLYYSYKLYMERLFEERRHSEEIQRINLDLERKVQERTAELEALNQRLQESNQQLQRVSHLKSEFLANMSHELRTPLNAIIGFSELLMDQTFGDVNEAQADYLEDILSSGRHLLELINDILDLSKIEAGKMELHAETFDVALVIGEAVTTLQVAAAKKRIDFTHQVAADVPAFCGDRAKFKQILYNLMSNAIKFTPEAGRVSVECRSRGSELEVSVSDTGIGIRQEDQGRIFDAFMQVDGSYSRKYQGTGLGLTLVKRFVELHGGRLKVESKPGQGSRFTFWLSSVPVSQGALPAAPERSAAPGLPTQRPSPASRRSSSNLILVVEDNPANLKLIGELLRARGYTVLEAGNGEDALARVRRVKPDLILMDLQLPGMDGLACARAIRSDPETAAIPTVALTAHAMKGDEERAREAGCVGYITKPINTSEFGTQIEGFLRQAAALEAEVSA